MTRQIIRGRFRAIAPGIAAIAVAVLITAGQIAFAPSADATGSQRNSPRASDTCTRISSSDRVVATSSHVDRVVQTIERTTQYRCVEAGTGATFTYSTRTRWSETARSH